MWLKEFPQRRYCNGQKYGQLSREIKNILLAEATIVSITAVHILIVQTPGDKIGADKLTTRWLFCQKCDLENSLKGAIVMDKNIDNFPRK